MSKYTDAVERGSEGLECVSSGVCSRCEQCQSNHGLDGDEIARLQDNGELPDEGSYSWQDCDLCGSGLGGDRYDAHGLDKDHNIVHLDICVDCVMYVANGDEPEEWR